MSKNINSKGKFRTVTKGNVDFWFGGGSSAYQSKQEALNKVKGEIRRGRTVGILTLIDGTTDKYYIREWVWPETDITDADLQPKDASIIKQISDNFVSVVNGKTVKSFELVYDKTADNQIILNQQNLKLTLLELDGTETPIVLPLKDLITNSDIREGVINEYGTITLTTYGNQTIRFNISNLSNVEDNKNLMITHHGADYVKFQFNNHHDTQRLKFYQNKFVAKTIKDNITPESNLLLSDLDNNGFILWYKNEVNLIDADGYKTMNLSANNGKTLKLFKTPLALTDVEHVTISFDVKNNNNVDNDNRILLINGAQNSTYNVSKDFRTIKFVVKNPTELNPELLLFQKTAGSKANALKIKNFKVEYGNVSTNNKFLYYPELANIENSLNLINNKVELIASSDAIKPLARCKMIYNDTTRKVNYIVVDVKQYLIGADYELRIKGAETLTLPINRNTYSSDYIVDCNKNSGKIFVTLLQPLDNLVAGFVQGLNGAANYYELDVVIKNATNQSEVNTIRLNAYKIDNVNNRPTINNTPYIDEFSKWLDIERFIDSKELTEALTELSLTINNRITQELANINQQINDGKQKPVISVDNVIKDGLLEDSWDSGTTNITYKIRTKLYPGEFTQAGWYEYSFENDVWSYYGAAKDATKTYTYEITSADQTDFVTDTTITKPLTSLSVLKNNVWDLTSATLIRKFNKNVIEFVDKGNTVSRMFTTTVGPNEHDVYIRIFVRTNNANSTINNNFRTLNGEQLKDLDVGKWYYMKGKSADITGQISIDVTNCSCYISFVGVTLSYENDTFIDLISFNNNWKPEFPNNLVHFSRQGVVDVKPVTNALTIYTINKNLTNNRDYELKFVLNGKINVNTSILLGTKVIGTINAGEYNNQLTTVNFSTVNLSDADLTNIYFNSLAADASALLSITDVGLFEDAKNSFHVDYNLFYENKFNAVTEHLICATHKFGKQETRYLGVLGESNYRMEINDVVVKPIGVNFVTHFISGPNAATNLMFANKQLQTFNNTDDIYLGFYSNGARFYFIQKATGGVTVGGSYYTAMAGKGVKFYDSNNNYLTNTSIIVNGSEGLPTYYTFIKGEIFLRKTLNYKNNEIVTKREFFDTNENIIPVSNVDQNFTYGNCPVKVPNNITKVPICYKSKPIGFPVTNKLMLFFGSSVVSNFGNYEISIGDKIVKPIGGDRTYFDNIVNATYFVNALQEKSGNPNLHIYINNGPNSLTFMLNEVITINDFNQLITVKLNGNIVTPTNYTGGAMGFQYEIYGGTNSVSSVPIQSNAILQQEYDENNKEIVANRKFIHYYLTGDKEINKNNIASFENGECEIPVIFPETRKINFADKDGNIKYTSDTDKRTGYYDVANNVYYPDIIEHLAGWKYTFTAKSRNNYLKGSGSTSSSIPFSLIHGFSFDMGGSNKLHLEFDLTYQENNIHIPIKLNITVVKGGTEYSFAVNNITGDLKDNSLISNIFFTRNNYNNRPFIGFRINNSAYQILYPSLFIGQIKVDNRDTKPFKILEVYNSIEIRELSRTSNFNAYKTYLTVNLKDYLSHGKIQVHDSAGAKQWSANKLQFGNGFTFDATKNEVNHDGIDINNVNLLADLTIKQDELFKSGDLARIVMNFANNVRFKQAMLTNQYNNKDFGELTINYTGGINLPVNRKILLSDFKNINGGYGSGTFFDSIKVINDSIIKTVDISNVTSDIGVSISQQNHKDSFEFTKLFYAKKIDSFGEFNILEIHDNFQYINMTNDIIMGMYESFGMVLSNRQYIKYFVSVFLLGKFVGETTNYNGNLNDEIFTNTELPLKSVPFNITYTDFHSTLDEKFNPSEICLGISGNQTEYLTFDYIESDEIQTLKTAGTIQLPKYQFLNIVLVFRGEKCYKHFRYSAYKVNIGNIENSIWMNGYAHSSMVNLQNVNYNDIRTNGLTINFTKTSLIKLMFTTSSNSATFSPGHNELSYKTITGAVTKAKYQDNNPIDLSANTTNQSVTVTEEYNAYEINLSGKLLTGFTIVNSWNRAHFKIKKLNLSNNNLTGIFEIFQSSNYRVYKIEDYRINNNSGITGLANLNIYHELQYLDCSNCNIGVLTFLQTKLKTVIANNNKLTTIPSIPIASPIETLNYANNLIVNPLGLQVLNKTSLISLDLSNNKINADIDVSEFANLSTFKCEGNVATGLTKVLVSQAQLTKLNANQLPNWTKDATVTWTLKP